MPSGVVAAEAVRIGMRVLRETMQWTERVYVGLVMWWAAPFWPCPAHRAKRRTRLLAAELQGLSEVTERRPDGLCAPKFRCGEGQNPRPRTKSGRHSQGCLTALCMDPPRASDLVRRPLAHPPMRHPTLDSNALSSLAYIGRQAESQSQSGMAGFHLAE
jgi:hypothetical protein